MIINNNPISMAESLVYLQDSEKEKEIKGFIKKFVKVNSKEAKKIREELKKLNLIKINDSDISKIIDLFPEDKEDLNKILIGKNLDENETEKILKTIKEFK